MIKIYPKTIYKIDALGALLSSLFIGFGIFYFKNELGMPEQVLTILAIIPIFFCIYSSQCAFDNSTSKRYHNQLQNIAFANLIYCFLTMSLLFTFYQKITLLELIYFLLEMVVVVAISITELKLHKKIIS